MNETLKWLFSLRIIMQKSFRWWQHATEYSSPSHQLHKWMITPTCKRLPLPANDYPYLQMIPSTCKWFPLPANDPPYLQTIPPTYCLPSKKLLIRHHWVQQKVRSCHHEQDQTVHMRNSFIDGQLALTNCSDICPLLSRNYMWFCFPPQKLFKYSCIRQ